MCRFYEPPKADSSDIHFQTLFFQTSADNKIFHPGGQLGLDFVVRLSSEDTGPFLLCIASLSHQFLLLHFHLLFSELHTSDFTY